MAWSHRKILDETTMQAEIYCIAVTTIGADFPAVFMQPAEHLGFAAVILGLTILMGKPS